MQEKICMNEFLKYRFLHQLTLSPNGEQAAMVVTQAAEDEKAYSHHIWLYQKHNHQFLQLTSGNEKSFCWENDTTILFPSARDPQLAAKKQAGEEETVFYRISTQGGEAQEALRVPLNASAVVPVEGGYLVRALCDLRRPSLEGVEGKERAALLKTICEERDYEVLDELPFWYNGRGFINKRRNRFYFYDAQCNTLRAITPPLMECGVFALSPDRKKLAVAGTQYDSIHPQYTGIYVYDLNSFSQTVLLEDGIYDISQIAFWDDEALVFAAIDKKRYGTSENACIYTMPLNASAPELTAAPDRCLCSAIGSDCRFGSGKTFKVEEGKLYFTMAVDNATTLWCMDRDGTLTQITQGEGSVDMFDIHHGEVYAIAMLDMKLQEVYHLPKDSATFSQISQFNEEVLKGKYVAQPQKYSFIDTEGVRVDGWALLPRDFKEGGSYPAILDIHGGPKATYGEVFCHEMQFWANHGYFVIFSNPRGSGGRDNEFVDMRDRYGTIDYDNIMQFTDEMLKKYPQIDPKRVCVTGGSYGGFMTNWIIGHTDRFVAAASQRSISNWVSKCLATDIGYYHNIDQIHGDPWKTPEKFWDRSPLKYAPQAKTPTLFIHSNEDYRCWMAEGLQMFTALKMHGVPARLCLFKGENHELSRSGVPAHRIRRLKEITDWFDTYTAPKEK